MLVWIIMYVCLLLFFFQAPLEMKHCFSRTNGNAVNFYISTINWQSIIKGMLMPVKNSSYDSKAILLFQLYVCDFIVHVSQHWQHAVSNSSKSSCSIVLIFMTIAVLCTVVHRALMSRWRGLCCPFQCLMIAQTGQNGRGMRLVSLTVLQ